MPLSSTNTQPGNIVKSADIIQFFNLFTGAMTDQAVSLKNQVTVGGNQGTSTPAFTINGVAAQTADYLDITASGGAVGGIFKIPSSGVLTLGSGLTITSGGETIQAGGLTVTGAPDITLGTGASRIVPGATSISLRNNANSTDNLLITDAGAATIRAGLTITAGGLTVSAGNAGIGAAPRTDTAVTVQGALTTTGTAQDGVWSNFTASSLATAAAYAFDATPATAAAAFTCAVVAGFHANTPTKGAGSAITTAYGVLVEQITTGTTNIGALINTGLVVDGAVPTTSGTQVGFGGVTAGAGGGASATLTTVGGTGPATAAQQAWLKIAIGGNAKFIPYWA